jgi:hypothetical protein
LKNLPWISKDASLSLNQRLYPQQRRSGSRLAERFFFPHPTRGPPDLASARADALIDEVLHNLELVNGVCVGRPGIDELRAERGRGLFAASCMALK